MHKELNPELFGEKTDSNSKLYQPAAHFAMQAETQFLNVDQQLFEVRGEVGQIQEEIRKIKNEFQEYFKNYQLRFDKIAQTLARMEHLHNGFVQEASNRFATLNSKVVENIGLENKTQEMMDRHNGVVKNLEIRLQQMQKILNEKESQLMSQQQTLQMAKIEIAKLKRL